MSNIYKSADELIGGTPLLELTRLEKEEGLSARILAKLEYFNPAGSVKDRVAKAMIEDGEAKGLAREIPGSFIPGQFVNPANPAAHRASTGPEIWADTEGRVDIFVAGVGTGGTVTGVGSYLKERNPEVTVVAVEPASSPVLGGGVAGPHGLQGIGAGFVPEVLEPSVYDEVIAVEDKDAYEMGRRMGRIEGVLAGISSGCLFRKNLPLPRKITGVKCRAVMYNKCSGKIRTNEEEGYAAALETVGRRCGAGGDADR